MLHLSFNIRYCVLHSSVYDELAYKVFHVIDIDVKLSINKSNTISFSGAPKPFTLKPICNFFDIFIASFPHVYSYDFPPFSHLEPF